MGRLEFGLGLGLGLEFGLGLGLGLAGCTSSALSGASLGCESRVRVFSVVLRRAPAGAHTPVYH